MQELFYLIRVLGANEGTNAPCLARTPLRNLLDKVRRVQTDVGIVQETNGAPSVHRRRPQSGVTRSHQNDVENQSCSFSTDFSVDEARSHAACENGVIFLPEVNLLRMRYSTG